MVVGGLMVRERAGMAVQGTMEMFINKAIFRKNVQSTYSLSIRLAWCVIEKSSPFIPHS